MIIGIMGFIGTGKSTVSNILIHEYGFFQTSFAESLKDATANIFGWDRALLEGDTSDSRKFREQVDEEWSKALGWEITPRIALQMIGTESGRDVFGENLWTTACMKRINSQPDKDWVISDCRFPNEIQTIRNHGGKIIQVNRGPNPEWMETAIATNAKMYELDDPRHMIRKYPNIHFSEWAWLGKAPDAVIHNNATQDELRINLSLVMNHISGANTEMIITGPTIDTIT